MGKIGLITYHSAYNYGSALQAFATQEVISALSHEKVEIIDYRTTEQARVYSLYRRKHGLSIFIKDCCLFPVHFKRVKRNERFEAFFEKRMNLTDRVSSPEQAQTLINEYKVMISGSDQIWNKHSLELADVSWDEMNPYLLVGYDGVKISYASSVGNMTDEDILHIKEYIEQFDYVSCRESSSANKIKSLTMCSPSEVLDPTFLINQEKWIELLSLQKNNEKYILFYGLGGIGYLHSTLKVLKPYANDKGCKLKVVMPYAYLPFQGANVEFCADAGPKEFLELILNAQEVVTNSYHGTILSINFEKDFYSICTEGGSEFRKTEILKKLGLENRTISSVSQINECSDSIDYTSVRKALSDLRENSIKYLDNCLL